MKAVLAGEGGRSLRARLAALLLSGVLAACGGGDAQPDADAAPQSGTAHVLTAKAAPPAATASVVTLTKVSETRVGRTVFDYVFRISVRNDSQALLAVTATLTAAGPGTTIIDGNVLVGDMAAGATVSPGDTITLRHNRAFAFDPAALVWRLRSAPAEPAIVPGATLFNDLAGQATVGSLYEASLRLAPVDARNAITTLLVSNATPGGAVPSISLLGLVRWTPNEADFATTVLRITAGLRDGSSSVFDVSVVVTKFRLVAQLALNGPGRYSDANGQYLIDTSAADAASSVIGILTISERYDVSGAFTPVITSSDSTHLIEVVNAPLGIAAAVAPAVASVPSARARTQSAQPAQPLATSPSLVWPEPIFGQKVDTGINVYTTRQDVKGPDGMYRVLEVARVEANCLRHMPPIGCAFLPGTPVILIHGFTPEISGLGGGTDTWGALAEKLTGLGHPVFELRWLTLMRFEEAAGLLTWLGADVAQTTGRKPFIIAHSFGGVVAHLALAGKGTSWNPSAKKWEKKSAGSKSAPLFDGLVTLGAPLSGINDDGARTDFVKGRYFQDISINFCMQVTCVQAGAFDIRELDSLQRNVALLESTLGIRPASGSNSILHTAESIERIRDAWLSDVVALPLPNLHTVVSLRERPFDDYTPDLNSAAAYRLGDGLIAMVGQAVLTGDFTCNGTAVTAPEFYDMAGCLARRGYPNFLAAVDMGPAANAADSLLHVTLDNGRRYHFASRAAHTILAQVWLTPISDPGFTRYETRPYGIAHFEDTVVVGEDWRGRDYRASHPLRYFIDNVLRQSNPTLAPPNPATATVRGSVVVEGGGFSISQVPAWYSILRYDGAQPEGARAVLHMDAAGGFSLDAAAELRSAKGSDVVLSNYKIRLEFGDGIVFYVTTADTERLHNDSAVYDLGVVRVQPVSAPSPLVSAFGTVTASNSASALAGADVWLARGVNLSAADVQSRPDSNAARHLISDANGAFNATGLRAGDYTVVASRSGYTDTLQGRVVIDGSQPILIVMSPTTVVLTRLNDTGVTASQCYAAGSDVLVSCTSAAAIALNPQQDGMVGRDVTQNDNSDGKAGFSFSLVRRPSGGSYARTECVKDNVTGLMWEGKTADGGLRDYNRAYTNWGDGRAGDASAYAVAVNAVGLCGYTNWRLPTAEELQSLVDYGVPYDSGPTIDSTWFPNAAFLYWSSSPSAGNAGVAWAVGNGGFRLDYRYYAIQLRLVRASQ